MLHTRGPTACGGTCAAGSLNKTQTERLVIRQADPFAAAYRLRLERGTLPTRAKLAIARKLIDVLCALWNNKEDYDPQRVRVV